MISIKNISKTFREKKKEFKALDDVSLEIEHGSIVGVIGFSGAGKSTLLRSLNLLERPDSGKIVINGKDLTALTSKALAEERKKIGMIFQHFNLLSSRTVFDNVALPLEINKISRENTSRRVKELLKIVDLEDKAHEYPKSLSGGQKQRVAIARALANDSHLLLCDEATSALDPATTQSILQLLKDINQKLGITIVLITHEMEVVKAICHQVVIIDKGKIILKGAPTDLMTYNQHPVIKQFTTSKEIRIPLPLSNRLQNKHAEGYFPLVEIELTGNMPFDQLLSVIHSNHRIPYKLIAADIEYVGKTNYGKLLLHLQGSLEDNSRVLQYFNKKNIQNTIKGYA